MSLLALSVPRPDLRPRARLLIAALLASVGLVALMGATAPAVADEEDTDAGQTVDFDDLNGESYTPAVEAIAEAGIITGCEEGRFCPDRDVTRGQMATMLVEALGIEPRAQNGDQFTDIADSAHRDSILAISGEDIVNGCEEDRFCPSDTVTRGQLATMIARAFFLTPSETTHFDDTADGAHGDAIERVADRGIAGACDDPLNNFCAHQPVPRWQAAEFIARALRLVDPVELAPLEERRAEQEQIDAEREAERRAEEERRAEQERAAADPWGISQLSDQRIATWERLAQCESNGNWRAVSANGLYYGGLQFHPQTWRSVGGSGLPNQASRAEQIYRAERLLEQPWATWRNQWPACSRRLGLG